MSAGGQPESFVARLVRWTLRLILSAIMGLVALVFLAAFRWPLEFLYHLAAGWLFHIGRDLSRPSPGWHGLLSPMVLPGTAALVALCGFHRLALWWRRATGRGEGWRFQHTALAGLLVLLGASAAIALSAVLHEAVWLPQGPVIQSNRSYPRIQANSEARHLGLYLFEYETDKGRLPVSFRELEEHMSLQEMEPRIVSFVDLGHRPPEPFVLLRPGGKLVDGTGPLLMSPALPERGEFVVLGFNNSVRTLPPRDLEEFVRSAHRFNKETR